MQSKLASVPNDFEPNDSNYKLIDKFIFYLAEIIDELHDNYSTVFNLYFIIKPDFNKIIKFDIVKLNEHFNKYPLEYIDSNIVKFYKNTGLLNVSGVLVFAPCLQS